MEEKGEEFEKRFDHKKYEETIYSLWEKAGAFTPKINPKKKPFTIILPLPNANDPMHMGHALFTVEDILIRYHRMLGDPALWLPGGDHAGIETQFVFEKKLQSKGQSRLDYDRNTLFKMIKAYADKNKDINKQQMKRLGFSLDWSRYHYSLEPEIIKQVLATFKKLHKDNLVYRGERIVNYCTHCGTAFSDLEIKYKEKKDYLYFLNYQTISIATTRPETIFADVAVAVNPKDKRYTKLIGKKATIPLIGIDIPILADENIDLNFGTGALKVTPAHDLLDYEIGIKNKLETISIISKEGKMMETKRVPKKLHNLSINKAREATIELLKKEGKLIKEEPLKHSLATCYRCGATIEPLIMPQWFVKTAPLAKPAVEAVKKGLTKIVPKKRFEKMYFDWMENIKDWNISRQIVWGPRIPVWFKTKDNPLLEVVFIDQKGKRKMGNLQTLLKTHSFSEIEKGLQQLIAPEPAKYVISEKKPGRDCLQDTDTFDTWFLSGQWPLTTLGYNVDNPQKSSPDFKYFYPTSVLDTLWDILFFWVGRMMMFGLYLTKKAPFATIHLHARVVDKNGKKMSKSKGNVVDPLFMVEKYGADALRLALTIGVGPGGDIAISDEKVKGMRNFANKIWNLGRYLDMVLEKSVTSFTQPKKLNLKDKQMLNDLKKLISIYTSEIENYKFGSAAEKIYDYTWHRFADQYIEETKEKARREDAGTLFTTRHVYLTLLKLLHPYMPFVTESVWQKLKKYRKDPNELLITSTWPK